MAPFARQISFRSLCFISLCGLWVSLTFSNALVEIFSVAALVSWVIWKIRQRHWVSFSFPRILWIPLLGFVLISVFSILWSEHPYQSFRGIFKVLQQVMIFYLVVDVVRTETDYKTFEVVFIVLYLVIIANGFYQYAVGKDFIRGFYAEAASAGLRVSGSFRSYGHFATFLICTLPFLATLGLRDPEPRVRKGKTYLCIGMTIAALVLLFLTRSRGAALALICGFVFFLAVKRKFIVLLMLFFALLAGALILPRGMVIHLDAEGKEQSLVERYYLWDRAVSVIRAKPLEGTGINTYTAAHAQYDRTGNWRVRNYYAHSKKKTEWKKKDVRNPKRKPLKIFPHK